MRIVAFGPQHARAAAELHIMGQPGTFLTSLGTAFLRALYGEMAASAHCYGFVAQEDGAAEGAQVLGVVVGSADARQVFKDLIWRRGLRLALPVAAALIRRPRLMVHVWQTLSYPDSVEGQPGEAELFYIGVRPDTRRRGVGATLLQALVQASRQRGMDALGLTVEATNAAALAFYARQGMTPQHELTLYGRRMLWLRLPLQEREEREPR